MLAYNIKLYFIIKYNNICVQISIQSWVFFFINTLFLPNGDFDIIYKISKHHSDLTSMKTKVRVKIERGYGYTFYCQKKNVFQ